MCLEFQTITPMSVQISILIGKVFQSKVSDGLVHSLKPSKSYFISSQCVWGHNFLELFIHLEQIIAPMSVQNIVLTCTLLILILWLPCCLFWERRSEAMLHRAQCAQKCTQLVQFTNMYNIRTVSKHVRNVCIC